MRIPSLPTRAPVLVAATLFALASSPGVAQADVGEKIIDRCTHGESLRGFSQAAYRQALKDLSAGTEEYSNCAQLIRQAQLAGAGSHSGGGEVSTPQNTAAAVTPTPAEQRSIAHAPSAGAAPLRVGGQTIHPGVVHADIASALSSLPTPLLATLAFLLLCLLLALGSSVRNRIRADRSQ